MRKNIRKIHLWLGLLSGLILSVVSITGSLYVFEPELSPLLCNQTYHTQGEKNIFESDIQIASYIEQKTKGKVESLQWPQRGRETYMFKLFDNSNWHYFDQTTGKITGDDETFGSNVFGFLLDLHMSLTLGDVGYVITATASLIFAIFMLSTGIYLWWPHNKGRKKSSFKIKWNAKPKRFNYDLHNVTGFYFSIPLFLMGITGAWFYYDKEIQWVIDTITFSRPDSELNRDINIVSDTSLSKNPLTIQAALKEMNKYNTDYYKRNLWMTDNKQGTLSFAYQKYNHVHSGGDTRIFLTADRYTGEIKKERNPDKLPVGATITAKWFMPIHFGEFGGLITRTLWFIAGFIPALLTYTGVKLWWGRINKENRERTCKDKQVYI